MISDPDDIKDEISESSLGSCGGLMTMKSWLVQ